MPAVIVSSRSSSIGSLGRDHEDRRPTKVGQSEPPVGVSLAQRARRDVDLPQHLTGPEDVLVVAGDEIGCVDGAFGAVGGPQRVGGLQRHRHRDHRACGQGHADVAADRRGVPHLERGQERFTAGGEQRGRPPVVGRSKRVQVADSAHGADLEPGVAGRQGVPAERHQVDQPAQVGLLVGEQPGSAGQPGIAVAPLRTGRVERLPNHLGDGVDIQINSPWGLTVAAAAPQQRRRRRLTRA